MSIEFKLPELGENIQSGDVVNVLVEEGEPIAANQGVCELETDKAVVEIPCPHGGRVVKIHIHKGDTVRVGQTLLTLDTDGSGKSAEAQSAAAEETARGNGDAETGRRGDAETTGGAGASISVSPGGQAAGISSRPASGSPAVSPAEVPDYGAAPVPAGPATRRLARQMGVDLRRVHGSGPHGRITPEDIQAAFNAARTPPAPEPAVATTPLSGPPAIPLEPVVPPGEPAQDAWGRVRREQMSKIRRTIAAQMAKSASTIPHVTNFDDADVTELEQLRKGIPHGVRRCEHQAHGHALCDEGRGHGPAASPACSTPASTRTQEQVIYKEYVHLGVAVDTPRGLVVPVVRNVDRMNIGELARALVHAGGAGPRRAVHASRISAAGPSRSATSARSGAAYSTPIINHPEVAILLLGRTRWLPEVREEGRIEPRLMMPLSLSYDHRLVDGAAAARFLNEVIDHLQNPGRLLLAD